jgi:hypothetical protein
LQCLCLVIVLWLCLPSLRQVVGPSQPSCGIEGGPADVAPGNPHGTPESIHAQLLTLEFKPLGLYWEKGFGLTFWECAYAAPDQVCFATAYRLYRGEQPRLAFLTVFTSGAVVLTQNYEGGQSADEADFRAGGLVTDNMAELLVEHYRRLDQFHDAGHTPMKGETLEDFLHVQYALHANPTVARQHRRNSLGLAIGTLAMLGFAFGKVAFDYGFNHPATWGVLLVECGGMVFFRLYGHGMEVRRSTS